MAACNPFDDTNIAVNYEDWYHTTGKIAAIQEKRLIRTLLSHFDDAQTILEVGCGTGYFTNWMKTKGYKASGLDRSRTMIREAQKAHHLFRVQGDAISLPFASHSFDLIIMITTLEFISDPLQALSESLRVARQGLILGVINRKSLLGWRYRQKGGPIWGTAKFYTPRELIRMVSKFISEQDEIIYKTTLWPFFPGSFQLPWGGFIGLGVILSSKRR